MPKKITKTTTFRKAKTTKRSKPATFAKRVKAVISKVAETKMVSHDSGLVAYNSGISVSTDVMQIVPTMAQGDDTGMRTGNRVTAKNLSIKGHMLMSLAVSNISTSVRIAVRQMVLVSKRYKNFSDMQTNFASHLPFLLKSGNSVQGFTGIIQDLYLPINREIYTVLYDKIVYLNLEYQATASGFQGVADSVKFFNINVKCKNKILNYEESNSNVPQNWNPFMCFGYAKLDGATPDVALNLALYAQHITNLTYTDL